MAEIILNSCTNFGFKITNALDIKSFYPRTVVVVLSKIVALSVLNYEQSKAIFQNV